MITARTIGRYELLNEIARGGMGVVFRAVDTISRRKVAVKVLLDPDPDPRLVQEIRSLARLRHEGVAAFYDIGQDEHGRPFVVMELVEGESLRSRQRVQAFSVDRAVTITQQICRAINYVHSRGVIHRDIKPDNVLLTPDGQVKLVDFGMGKVQNHTQAPSKPSLTETGDVMGTPAYMPPEQAEGDKERMGPRSDVYSIGATLYSLLTGVPPFQSKELVGTLFAVMTETPAAPSTHNRDVPVELDEIVLKCLAKDPDDRFQSAEDLEEALHYFRTGTPRETTAHDLRFPWLFALTAAFGILCVGLSTATMILANGDTAPAAAAVTATPPERDRLDQAKEYMHAKRWEDARAELEAHLEQDPNSWDANFALGLALRQLGDHRAALAHFDRAIEVEPGRGEGYVARGLVYSALGESNAALRELDRALELGVKDPADVSMAQLHRAGALATLGDLAGAEIAAEIAVEHAPEGVQDPQNVLDQIRELRQRGPGR